MTAEKYLDSIRASELERAALLEKLDASASAGIDAARRAAERFEYRRSDIAVFVIHPGGSTGRFLVCTRNISRGGMGFLHGGFLHNHTEVQLRLTTHDGAPTIVPGEVVNCRHLSRGIHEIGVRFSTEIDPLLYCGPRATVVAPLDHKPAAAVPASLEGTALLIALDESETKAIQARLTEAGMSVLTAATEAEALEQIKSPDVSIVICNVNPPNEENHPLPELLAESGLAAPLIGLAPADTDLDPHSSEHCDAILWKPVPLDGLCGSIAGLLEQTNDDGASPIHSELARDPGAREMLESYIEQVDHLVKQIGDAAAKKETNRVTTLCKQIRSTGSGYGFPGLMAASNHVISSIQRDANLEGAAQQIQELIALCARLSAEAPEPAPARAKD